MTVLCSFYCNQNTINAVQNVPYLYIIGYINLRISVMNDVINTFHIHAFVGRIVKFGNPTCFVSQMGHF